MNPSESARKAVPAFRVARRTEKKAMTARREDNSASASDGGSSLQTATAGAAAGVVFPSNDHVTGPFASISFKNSVLASRPRNAVRGVDGSSLSSKSQCFSPAPAATAGAAGVISNGAHPSTRGGGGGGAMMSGEIGSISHMMHRDSLCRDDVCRTSMDNRSDNTIMGGVVQDVDNLVEGLLLCPSPSSCATTEENAISRKKNETIKGLRPRKEERRNGSAFGAGAAISTAPSRSKAAGRRTRTSMSRFEQPCDGTPPRPAADDGEDGTMSVASSTAETTTPSASPFLDDVAVLRWCKSAGAVSSPAWRRMRTSATRVVRDIVVFLEKYQPAGLNRCLVDCCSSYRNGAMAPSVREDRREGKRHQRRMVQVPQASILAFILLLLLYCCAQINNVLEANREQMIRLRQDHTNHPYGEDSAGPILTHLEVGKGALARDQRGNLDDDGALGSTGGEASSGHRLDAGGVRAKGESTRNQRPGDDGPRQSGTPSSATNVHHPVGGARPSNGNGETSIQQSDHNASPPLSKGGEQNDRYTTISERMDTTMRAYANFADFPSEGHGAGFTPTFWHIPKAAGSTLKDTMGRCMGMTLATVMEDRTLQVLEKGKLTDTDTIPEYGMERTNMINMADVVVSPELPVLSTLFHPEQRGKLFTVFRDPVERAVSMFHYLSHASWEPGYDPELASWTLEQYARSNRTENNWMTRYLTNEMDKKITDHDLDVAKEILRTKFLVGLIDKTEESFHRFIAYFGWTFPDGQDQLSQSRRACMKELLTKGSNRNGGTKERIQKGSIAEHLLQWKNKYDIKLYRYAEELFASQSKFFE